MKRFLSVVVLGAMLLSVALLAGCSGGTPSTSTSGGGSSSTGSAGAESGSINIAGSDTMVNMAGAWAQAYMSVNPNAQITVKGGGSGTGIKALIDGTVDVADASREMKPEELDAAKAKGFTPVANKVARDGISIIVNPANGVEQLTTDQLGKIYRGEITNWKAVGGADKPIVVLSRDNSSGTFELFSEKIVGKDKKMAPSVKLLPSNQAIVTEVQANDAAIGYCGVGYADKATGIKIVALDGVKASVAAVKDGTYKLSRYLYMYTKGEPTGLQKTYIDWILGSDGQKIVEDQGFVTVQ